MTKNVGRTERRLRLVGGAAAVVLGSAGTTGLLPLAVAGVPSAVVGVLVLAVGAVLAASGITGSCPVYRAAGVDTRDRARDTRRRPEGDGTG